eukprot:NODE_27089_length_526_cov_3.037594.p1 GENE.NODE_27089_length_526_cov_3.037594~~NODE_27089_length_526_cov_3.037594.p1  ORF type:complete len:131 (+),score=31.15 NODE_27089_length_526_cov_3.037594:49-393(+)
MTEAEYQKSKGSEFWPACSFDLSSELNDVHLEKSIICDYTKGVLIHDAKSSLNHMRPQEGCHEYKVVGAKPESVAHCTMGVECDFCHQFLPFKQVIATLAIDASTCTNQGPRCP